jgi:hypothetical protein
VSLTHAWDGRVDEKTRLLLVEVRKMLLQIVARLEDTLEIPYDQSGLSKRTREVRKYG